MKSSSSFYVFEKWKDAPAHAFGSKTKSSLVPAEDKNAYSQILKELQEAAIFAKNYVLNGERLQTKQIKYSPKFGSRGHRPVDLWVSLCDVAADAFGYMPQVYAIASERGLEVGFAVSINEADYHDPSVKARNRTIVPLLNSKLPKATDAIVVSLEAALTAQGGWHYNNKTRLTPRDEMWGSYNSLSDMLTALKNSGAESGGGTICRVFDIAQLSLIDVEAEFANAMELFLPLIAVCAPTSWDKEIAANQDAVQQLSNSVSFDPSDVYDGRTRVLAEVARRQGQMKFREQLLKAYEGRCAITGTVVPAVLEAAHITPYLGQITNHVTNGLLLRADIHTLLDLHLIRIDPDKLTVHLAESLRATEYEQYEGQKILLPSRKSERPSIAALKKHFQGSGGSPSAPQQEGVINKPNG